MRTRIRTRITQWLGHRHELNRLRSRCALLEEQRHGARARSTRNLARAAARKVERMTRIRVHFHDGPSKLFPTGSTSMIVAADTKEHSAGDLVIKIPGRTSPVVFPRGEWKSRESINNT